MRNSLFALALVLSFSGCEPKDEHGGELLAIQVVLSEKNPGVDGNYILHVGERSRMRATGIYSTGREEDITLSLFWVLTPEEPAELYCLEDELLGSWVMLEGLAPGILEVLASTRLEEDALIPCSPTPDGGWEFRDAGTDWPRQSEPIYVEVKP